MAKPVLTDRFNGVATSLKARAKRVSKATGDSMNVSVLFDETKKDATVQISIENHDKVSRRIALFAGDLLSVEEIQKVAGIDVDAIANDGVVITDAEKNPLVEVSCKNLAYLQRFIVRNPTRISAIQLSTDNESQFYNPITLSKFGPTRTYGSQDIKPSSYLDPSNPNKTMCVIDNLKHFQLDHAHVLDFTVGSGRRLEISLQLGTSIDTAETLDESAKILIG